MRDDIAIERSLWSAIAPPAPVTGALSGDIRAEVAIIGGGYTGCCAALELAGRGNDVVLLEGREIGWGGSGRNAGLVNAGLWLDPDVIVRHFGDRYGPRLVEGLGNAPRLVRALIERHAIDCDPGRIGIMKAAHSSAGLAVVAETVRQWRGLGAPLDLLDAGETRTRTGSSRFPGALIDHRSFTIEPLAYARGLGAAAIAAGARLFTASPALGLEPLADAVRVVSGAGSVTAGRVIIATGAYEQSLLPGMQRSFVPVGYFMFATEPLSHNLRRTILPDKAAVYDTSPSLLVVRYDRDYRLIVGNVGWLPAAGGGHKWARAALQGTFPEVGDIAFTRGWSGTLDFTDDHMPWLGQPLARVHMVGGFNGRGIAPGAFWGRVLADWVTGLPDADLPVPVQPMPAISHGWLKQHYFANGPRAYRLASRLRAMLG